MIGRRKPNTSAASRRGSNNTDNWVVVAILVAAILAVAWALLSITAEVARAIVWIRWAFG